MKKNFYNNTEKFRQAEVIAYPENMIPDWQDKIGEVLQVPCCYIIHDKDNVFDDEEPRKIHVHIWLVWNNTVRLSVFLKHVNRLSVDQEKNPCASTVQPVLYPEQAYKYMLHADDKSIALGKHLYDKEERKCINNFDIGVLVELNKVVVQELKCKISDLILDLQFQDCSLVYQYIRSEFGVSSYEMAVFQNYINYFDKIVTGVWKKYQRENEKNKSQ